MFRPALREIGNIFFRVGNATFGSGAAATVQLREQIVEDRGWLGKHQFALCYALARVTPGTNLYALFSAAGWYLRGWPGAIVAILAASLPASMVVVLLTLGYLAIYTNRLGQAAIIGAMAAVVGTIIGGAWQLIEPDILSRNWFRTVVLVAGAMILAMGFDVSPLPIIGLAALAGFFWQES
ncbi:MAG: chromate transporter [Bryobacteraceae bacterium]